MHVRKGLIRAVAAAATVVAVAACGSVGANPGPTTSATVSVPLADNACYTAVAKSGQVLTKVQVVVDAAAKYGYRVATSFEFRAGDSTGKPVASPLSIAPGSIAGRMLKWRLNLGERFLNGYIVLKRDLGPGVGSALATSGGHYAPPPGFSITGALLCLSRPAPN